MSYKKLAEALLLGKPYFGSALRARQGVLERHQYFLPVVRSIPRERLDLDILEIGSWAGASTVTWALSLREAGRQGKVTCVDPWEAYFEIDADTPPHYKQMSLATADDLIFRLFEHNLHATCVAEMVEVRRGVSRTILPGFPAGSFDLVYIDGSHQFEDVQFDIREAKRLVREGGVVCGDDLEIEAHALAENELRQGVESGRDYVFSDGAQRWYHPGVTGAVAGEFDTVAVWNGFWAGRRSGERWEALPLDLTALHMPHHLDDDSSICRLLASAGKYNLVQAGTRYFAIDRALGSVDLFEESLGERSLPPVLLMGDSLEAVRQAAEAMTPVRGEPTLTGSHRGFNLVSYAGHTYALRQSLGLVNVTDGESELLRRFGPDHIIVADSVDLARVRIDALTDREDVNALRAEMNLLKKELLAAEAMTPVAEEPTLTGSHRGFNLVSYAGHTYALRQSLESVNVTDGESELLRRFGPDHIIVADSVDLARVRIDALVDREEVNALRAETNLLKKELLAAEARLMEGLRQADERSASNASGLDKLNRSPGIRFLGKFSK